MRRQPIRPAIARAIRDWAAERGYHVYPVGKLPQYIVDDYLTNNPRDQHAQEIARSFEGRIYAKSFSRVFEAEEFCVHDISMEEYCAQCQEIPQGGNKARVSVS